MYKLGNLWDYSIVDVTRDNIYTTLTAKLFIEWVSEYRRFALSVLILGPPDENLKMTFRETIRQFNMSVSPFLNDKQVDKQ